MSKLHKAYELLHEAFGPQAWWPADSPLEVMIGAVLVQNTAWKNVEKAIRQLREEGMLNLLALARVPQEELEELIRPAGYYRIKAKRLKNLLRMIESEYGNDLDAFFSESTETLREKLLAVNGIGPETADSILLYAAERPKFVIDAYTYRVLTRHGWIDYETNYYEMQSLFEESLPAETAMFNEYHALLVQVGKDYCKKSAPKCDTCPLHSLLPSGGMVEPF